jgi:hypothetical protein
MGSLHIHLYSAILFLLDSNTARISRSSGVFPDLQRSVLTIIVRLWTSKTLPFRLRSLLMHGDFERLMSALLNILDEGYGSQSSNERRRVLST